MIIFRGGLSYRAQRMMLVFFIQKKLWHNATYTKYFSGIYDGMHIITASKYHYYTITYTISFMDCTPPFEKKRSTIYWLAFFCFIGASSATPQWALKSKKSYLLQTHKTTRLTILTISIA